MPPVNSPIASRRRWRLDNTSPAQRIVAFDYLRGMIVMLVVLHHSVLAYCRFSHFDRLHYLWSSAPVVDASKWLGFDLIVLFNDSYFMPLMFLLSGLFVWPGLSRKGSLAYARDRLLRLGLPFAVVVMTVIPLAYYASFRLTGAASGFGEFWADTILHGPWPSGPAWFVGLLLAFDLAAAAIHAIFRRSAKTGFMPRPWQCFGFLVALSAICYLPLLMEFGATRWFSFGPFAIQASRIGLYGVYFLAGVLAGRHGLRNLSAILNAASVRQWPLLALLLYLGFVALQIAKLSGRFAPPALAWLGFYGVFLILFCAAATIGWLAIVLRFVRRPTAVSDSLAANAYGIYLLHYVAVTWLQYALLELPLNVIAKATTVFITALLLSWGCTMALRRIPAVARII
jgi:peptidoglycan/LPS O-acetylase OafA/YrhL